MLTEQDWLKFEQLLDRRLSAKLDEKLEIKLNEKFAIFEGRIIQRVVVIIDKKIEELAIMIAHGFEEIHQKLNLKADKTDILRIEAKFDRVERKVYIDHENRIDTVEEKLKFQ